MVVTIAGRVQGVGFRVWARYQAAALGVVGWVKNRSDGRVEVLCEGKRDLIELLKTGI